MMFFLIVFGGVILVGLGFLAWTGHLERRRGVRSPDPTNEALQNWIDAEALRSSGGAGSGASHDWMTYRQRDGK